MTRTTLDSFESALLVELRAEVTKRATAGRPPVRRRMATLAAAAAVTTIAVVGVVTQRPDAAYALDRMADGDIVVTIHELSDSDGLERALAREGVVAEVTYDATSLVPSDLYSGDVRLSPIRIGTLDELMHHGAGCPIDNAIGVTVDPADDGGVTFTLARQFVASDETVLHLTTAGGSIDWMAVSVQWENSRC
jgi:hypothetical protein